MAGRRIVATLAMTIDPESASEEEGKMTRVGVHIKEGAAPDD